MRSFKENFVFVAVCLALSALFGVAILVSIKNNTNFKEICDQQGGVVAFDGRQYQCIRKLDK